MKTLDAYHKKRDFRKTSEPSGTEEGKRSKRRPVDAKLSFVVQKHDARNLHYDFRLEWEGVLKSWAVPKGPSDDPADKRLAIHVEDHPLDYGDFEGVIPKGEYGAGPVMVWDRGTWEPLQGMDPGKALRDGHLKLLLHGEKLKGEWTLTKMKGREDDQWLLIKHADEWSVSGGKKTEPLLDRLPKSVKSGRTIDEVRRGEEGAERGGKRGHKKDAVKKAESIDVGKRCAMPTEAGAMLATLVTEVPPGDEWLHEIKYDGYRILAFCEKKGVRLMSRNGKDWSDRFRSVTAALKDLEGRAVLDGEMVVLDDEGLSTFQGLQQRLKSGQKRQKSELTYYVFDLLWLDGRDLRSVALIERKEILGALLEELGMDSVRYSDHLQGNGEAFFRQGCQKGLEGIICKRASSVYRGRRTRDWLKVKCTRRQEFAIGGFTEPGGSRVGFGALLLGVHEDGKDTLRYAGRVGTGFNTATLESLGARLENLKRETPPFDDPPTGQEARGVTWVTPKLVGEVSFTEWTDEGRLRHPSFLGLREDKEADEVDREEPVDLEEALAGTTAKKKRKKKATASKKAGATSGKGAKTSQETSEETPPRSRKKSKAIMVGGISISNPERNVFPDAGVTKGDVAQYYEAVAEMMLPHVAERPLSVVRCPEGRTKQCFYQKHHSQGMHPSIGTVQVKEEKGTEGYMTVNSQEGLVALAQFGVLEIHPWLSRNDRLDRPDLMVFDLDPAEDVAWEEVLGAAYYLRDLLEGMDLRSFPKLTGGKGIHVVAPLTRSLDYEVVKPACKALVERVREANPKKFLVTASKAKRQGKIFLDYLRNGRGATAVAPFSLRARPGAPVALPVSWDEVRPGLRPDHYTISSVTRRLGSLQRDPWEGFFETKQTLKKGALKDLGVKG